MKLSTFARDFVLYLYTNQHLNDFTIEKVKAREIFKAYAKSQNVKIPFCNLMYPHIVYMLQKQNRRVLVFKENKIMTLLNKNQQTVLIGNNHNQNIRNYKTPKNQGMESTARTSRKPKIDGAGQLHPPPALELTIDDFLRVDNIILRPNVSKTLQLKLKNNTNGPIPISQVRVVKSNVDRIEFGVSPLPYQLEASASITFNLEVCSNQNGLSHATLSILTSDTEPRDFLFNLVFHTHDTMFDDAHPTEPFKPRPKSYFQERFEKIDSGEPPQVFVKNQVQIPLKPYMLPSDLTVVLSTGLKEFKGISPSQVQQLKYIRNLLNAEDKQRSLTVSNYAKLLDLFLYFEEHQLHKDIRDYDMEDQVLTKVHGFLELEVPGLAENRPSIIISDSVFVRESRESKTIYEGFVHRINETRVSLKFSHKFMDKIFLPKKKFYVHFSFNRYTFKVEHQAVELARIDNIAHLLFPKKISTAPVDNSSMRWFSRNIESNAEQQQAVRCILNKTSYPAPYLVFGPPGTGKTITIIEAVKQIHRRGKERILICAPSNSAANEVAKHLVTTIPTTDLFRYVAPSYAYNQIPNDILEYVNYKRGQFFYPTLADYCKYKIVITTLASAAKLVNNKCPPNHFGYVFVDESGQATESETLIPIARILSTHNKATISGQIVLAGDPRQLGPILHSSLAKEYGFGISMLERLINSCEPYARNASNEYNCNALTKLLKNYRSHPVIINRSKYHFYDNELDTAGDHMINAALNWEHLPNPQFPLIFHSVVGVDQREKNSPSFFNVQEIQVVANYLDKLIGCKMQGIKISEKHIGIVSPYKRQVDKLRMICRKKYLKEELLIGSVEQIQGQERLIIIVSTVRSRFDMRDFDRKFHLGFLDNPKRFNVAVTRAKALLIVVGNPNLLQYDEYWRSLIAYCKENGSCVGEPFELKDIPEVTENRVRNKPSHDEILPQEEAPSFRHGNI